MVTLTHVQSVSTSDEHLQGRQAGGGEQILHESRCRVLSDAGARHWVRACRVSTAPADTPPVAAEPCAH